jgi:putative ABC transport system permease protein
MRDVNIGPGPPVVTIVETLATDIRHAVRSLARMRGAGILATLTIAIGIGGATTMFSVVYGALLRPPPFADPDRLVILFNTRLTQKDGLQRLRWSYPNVVSLQQTASSFEAIATATPTGVSVSGHGNPEQIDGEVVSPEYFALMRVTPMLGRTFTAFENVVGGEPVAVLSERMWRLRYAADPNVLGQTVRINDVPLTIVGVLPAPFAGLSGKAVVWIPPAMAARLTYSEYMTSPQHFVMAVARLHVSLDQANAELRTIGARFADPGAPATTTWGAEAVTLADARVDAEYRRLALLLLAAASCVLLIACVNVASVLLARARTRRRETAIRLAMGSGRRRLLQQLLAEGVVMAAAAGAIGTVLAVWGIRAFTRAAPPVIPNGGNNYSAIAIFGAPALDAGVLLFMLAATAATTVVFALVPALGSSGLELSTALKEDDRGGGRSRKALAGLVVTEVALAVLLLTGAGLLIQAFARVQNLRIGFAPDNVLTFWLRPSNSRWAPADGPVIIERLLTRIQRVPGVDLAAVNRCTPFTGCARTVAFFADRPNDPQSAPVVGRHYVSADYFRTLGIPLVSGRALTDLDRAGAPPVVVIGETAAKRFWPGSNPIGQQVWFGATTGFVNRDHAATIVGIVGDVKYEGVDLGANSAGPAAYRPEFYTSYLQFSYPDTMVMVKSRQPLTTLLPALRSAVAEVEPSLPLYDILTLGDRVDGVVARPRFSAQLLGAFAGVALFLAAIGVYGMLSYSVSSRLRELRLALGAAPGRVVALIVGDGLRLATIGIAIGIAAALGAQRTLLSLVPGITSTGATLFAAVAAVMAAVAALAAFLPAKRAAAVDPIEVLRAE